MPDKKEARRSLQAGRATYRGRYTGSIPREDFERGCRMIGAMFALTMLAAFIWEVMCR